MLDEGGEEIKNQVPGSLLGHSEKYVQRTVYIEWNHELKTTKEL